jgi:predicted transcriptional regulator
LYLFFLDRSDPDEWYTRYSLKNEININYKTSKKHLPVLIQEDVLNSRDGSRGTEYQLAKTDTTRLLRQLNTMIVETALLD